MSRPARPQIAYRVPRGATVVWRAERTVEYVSTTKGRERRWWTLREDSGHAFSTLPQWKLA